MTTPPAPLKTGPAFYILSHTHSLFPVAHRLRVEGYEVRVGVWVKDYEAGWVGCERLPRDRDGKVRPDALGELVKEVEGGLTFITDVHSVETVFQNGPLVFGTTPSPTELVEPYLPLRLVSWWSGEAWCGLWANVSDTGLWPGGQGPQQPGAETLIRILDVSFKFQELLDAAQALLAPHFKGLVRMYLSPGDPPGLAGVEVGWTPLLTEAWLNGTRELGQLTTSPGLGVTYDLPISMVAWVSQSPWPHRGRSKPKGGIPLVGVPDGKVFWHDVTPDHKERVFRTGGRDGLLGAARGAGYHFTTARTRLAQVMLPFAQVPGVQMRADAGAGVPQVLVGLEELGLIPT